MARYEPCPDLGGALGGVRPIRRRASRQQPNEAAEPTAQQAQLPLVVLELFGMGVAAGHHGRFDNAPLGNPTIWDQSSTRGALRALRRRALARA